MRQLELHGNVLITGGSGFLGRGILRRARRENWPCEFTIYSRDEYKQDVCQRKYPDARYVLGSINDTERLTNVMVGHTTVIHAAALKYIPEGEFNVAECVYVNVDGARSVITAARRAGVGRVVGISTDKAVQPINVYGMTKALMERLFGEASGNPTFITCRYGNVVGSTGSVVPVFQRQLREQGFITVTSPNMTRFWISVDDAVDIILEALNSAPRGATVIPKPKALSIGDLATALVCGREDKITYIGLRPGEKMHEDLLSPQEVCRTYIHGDYYHLMPPSKGMVVGDKIGPSGGLTSNKPESWLTAQEFLDLAEDATTV